MLVTADTIIGTIGGGQLEHGAIATARTHLEPATPDRSERRIVLGSHCGQCCGGVVTLTFERLDPTSLTALAAHDVSPPLEVTIFGGGHVGKALAQVLAAMDARVVVVDSRADALVHPWPDGVLPLYAADPLDAVVHCRPASQVLIMTHDHDLDFALCTALLTRTDLPFIGLIGSRTKERRFTKRLTAAGLEAAAQERLICPIGLPGLGGKHPGEIAVAVAAQLLTQRAAASAKGASGLAGVA